MKKMILAAVLALMAGAFVVESAGTAFGVTTPTRPPGRGK